MRGFSWKHGITEFPSRRLDLITSRANELSVCPYRVLANSAYGLEHGQPCTVLGLPFSVPAHFNAIPSGAGILTCFPSPTPFGLGLGTD